MHTRFFNCLIVLAIATFPVLLMTTHTGGSGMFYGLIGLCLADLSISGSKNRPLIAPLRPYFWLFAALSVTLVIAVVTQAIHHTWNSGELEKALRVSLGLPLLLATLLHCNHVTLRQAIWGLMIAGVVATLRVGWLTYPSFVRPDTDFYNAVGYGNLILLLAVLSLYSLAWHLTPYRKTEAAIKILATGLIFIGFILTQTRSGWVAMPLFIAIGLVLQGELKRPWRAVCTLFIILGITIAIGMTSPILRERVTGGFQEARDCIAVNHTADTSVCIRLQLWRMSWHLFSEHPWLGVGGTRQFQPAMQKHLNSKIVSAYTAEDFGETHNDLMLVLAGYGIFGAIGLLLFYFAPAWIFARRLTLAFPQVQRVAAAMGLAVCLGFAAFGLTELMFRGMRTTGFYVVLMSLFLALSHPKTLIYSVNKQTHP